MVNKRPCPLIGKEDLLNKVPQGNSGMYIEVGYYQRGREVDVRESTPMGTIITKQLVQLRA